MMPFDPQKFGFAMFMTTKISVFIDKLSEYTLLSSCAEEQVSSIVRDMYYMCGDGSEGTTIMAESYVCFCYQSAPKASSMIGKHVSTACSDIDPSQNTSALEVFSKYCQVAQIQGPVIVTSSASLSQSTSASPASSPTPISVTSTPSPPPPTGKKSDKSIAIAVGVTVPIAVIALSILGFFLFKLWKKPKGEQYELPETAPPAEAHTGGEVERYELKAERGVTPPLYEIAHGEVARIAELDSLPKEGRAYIESLGRS